jgi:hypothetical protein
MSAMTAGCDAGPADFEPSNLPPVHVTAVLAGTQVDTSVTPAAVTYAPLDLEGNSSSVSPTSSFHVRVDRLLDPTTATRQSICLQPFLGNVPAYTDCGDGVFLEPSYNPVLREVAYHLTTGNLVPGTRYALTLYSTSGVGAGGLVSYDGVALAETFQVEFDIVDTGSVLPPYEGGPTAEYFCGVPSKHCNPDLDATCARSVSAILGGCALGGCHGVSSMPDAGAPGQASEGLLLGGLAGIQTTAINQPAHETETGEAASQLETDSLRFGRAMAILSEQGPGYSYLVYKLLANRATPLTVPWPDGNTTTDPTEVALLRSSFVVGTPMPPDTAPSAALRRGEAEWLSAWLLQGAPMPTTPCR